MGKWYLFEDFCKLAYGRIPNSLAIEYYGVAGKDIYFEDKEMIAIIDNYKKLKSQQNMPLSIHASRELSSLIPYKLSKGLIRLRPNSIKFITG